MFILLLLFFLISNHTMDNSENNNNGFAVLFETKDTAGNCKKYINDTIEKSNGHLFSNYYTQATLQLIQSYSSKDILALWINKKGNKFLENKLLVERRPFPFLIEFGINNPIPGERSTCKYELHQSHIDKNSELKSISLEQFNERDFSDFFKEPKLTIEKKILPINIATFTQLFFLEKK